MGEVPVKWNDEAKKSTSYLEGVSHPPKSVKVAFEEVYSQAAKLPSKTSILYLVEKQSRSRISLSYSATEVRLLIKILSLQHLWCFQRASCVTKNE